MTKETGTEEQLPKGYRWDDLTKKDGIELLDFYKKLLIDLGGKGSGRVQAIFANATTSFRHPRNLRKFDGYTDTVQCCFESSARPPSSEHIALGQEIAPMP